MSHSKTLYLLVFMLAVFILASCSSPRKGRKYSKRQYRERCGCSRFSNYVNNNSTYTIQWITQHGGQGSAQ